MPIAMENSDIKIVEGVKKSWSDPEITILSVKDDTLGSTPPGPDGGSNS